MIQTLNVELETAHPAEILHRSWEAFGPEMAATSSFQTQSLPFLHLISRVVPEMPILFLDTGFHFPETLAYRDRLVQEWGLNVKILKPQMGHEGFRLKHGDLYRRNPDLCCYINKVEPLQIALKDLKAWVAGIRRDQTHARSQISIFNLQPDGQIKICPMAAWTRGDVWRYIHAHNLPEHPLLAQGYLSIGCAPCTRPAYGGDERSGRWVGQDKTECGLHLPERPHTSKKDRD